MATGTLMTDAQKYHTRQTHFLTREFSYLDDGLDLSLGYIPANSIVIAAGVVVSTAFDAGTTNVLDIGTAADRDGFATDLALGTIGRIEADEFATSNDCYISADTEASISVDLTGTAATAGNGVAYLEYVTFKPRGT